MLLPIFSVSASKFSGSTPLLIGLALGIYGLTSGCLQIPFGLLSDRFNRKYIVIFGLLLFIFGSFINASATDITTVIFGRALQGSGAVGSVILALLSDVTRNEVRTKSMAIIGMSIALSFVVAMSTGPILNQYFGLVGIFLITATLAISALILVIFLVPSPKVQLRYRDREFVTKSFFEVIKDFRLNNLYVGMFILHSTLTATFIVIPVLLFKTGSVVLHSEWKLYMPVLLIAFGLALPLIMYAEKRRKMKQVFCLMILFLGISEMGILAFYHNIFVVAGCLILFFIAFTFLEAGIPSLVSKFSHPSAKGTALGVSSSLQFFGAFFGSGVAGYILSHGNMQYVFEFSIFMLVIWLLLALFMKSPEYSATRSFRLERVLNTVEAGALCDALRSTNDFADVEIFPSEKMVYCKVRGKVDYSKKISELLREQK